MEYPREIAAAALVLVLVLVVSYMALHLAQACREDGQRWKRTFARQPFLAGTIYRPACGNQWLARRRESCLGITKGHPPSIDADVPRPASEDGRTAMEAEMAQIELDMAM